MQSKLDALGGVAPAGCNIEHAVGEICLLSSDSVEQRIKFAAGSNVWALSAKVTHEALPEVRAL